MSDDYPDNNSTPGNLWFNYPGLNASCEVPGDIDWFYYPQGQPNAAILVTNAQFEYVRIQVIAPHNHSVIAEYYGPAANAHINIEPGGITTSFYISVQGFTADGAPAAGTYTISASSIENGDDHGDDAASASPLTLDGPPTPGVINYHEDWDWFLINGMHGEPIRIDLTSAEFAHVLIVVRDQFGNGVATYNGPTSGVSLVAPPNAHTVAILGFDASGNYDTGAYSLLATSIPDDHGDSAATATPLVIDGPPVTAVNEGSDSDWFSFQAQAGTPLVFNFLALPPGPWYAAYTIYDQYGRSLYFTNRATDLSEYHPFTPALTGMYYIEFVPTPYDTGPAGSVSFQILTATDDYSDTLPANGVLTIDGSPVDGRHDYNGDFDVFAIDIDEAGTYRFEITPLVLFRLHELLALYDANGDLIAYRVAVGPGEGLTLHVDAPGRYYLGVEQTLGLVNHDWRYSVAAYSVTDDYHDSTETVGVITVDGEVVHGAIDYNEDIDWLRFEATAGDVVRIEFTTTGFAAHSFHILDDEGATVATIFDSIYDNDVYYVGLQEGGTFYFALGDPFGGQTSIGTGAYSIGISSVPGESALPNPLAIGAPANGTITYAGGDSDAFVFTAEAGQTIVFDVEADFNWKLSIWRPNAGGGVDAIVLEPFAYGLPRGYTFTETGTYYLTVRGFQPTTTSTDDLGAYTLHSTIIPDDNVVTLVLDGPGANGVVNYENDTDWFAITVGAGQTVHFNVTHDASITSLNWGLERNEGISFMPGGGIAHRFDQAGTYFVHVQGTYWEEVGGSYTVTAVSVADDYRSDAATEASMTVGGPAFVGQFEHTHDNDWIAIELVAGEDYIFTVFGDMTPGNHLNGAIDIHDQAGVLLDSSGLSVGASTEFIFTASYTGTHYLGVTAQSYDSRPYTLTAAEFTPGLIETISPGLPALPDDSFDHTHHGPANVINIYFAAAGDEFGDIVSDGWFAEEIDAVMAVLSTFEAYLNIDFQVTDFLPYADVVFTTFDDPGAVSIFQRADWDVPVPLIGFSYTSPIWTSEALTPGGLGAAIVLNAMGYALGLSLPHAPEGDSYGMDGVIDPFDTGDFDLNQGVYTIMSFNDGWVMSPYGLSPSDGYGWQATPMALDIAALQALYGANTTANAGATTYVLSDANAAGAAWRSIWDTSGIDTIIYSGAQDATIDLRAATLEYATGGAGFLSFADGIHGGYTIANGVVIENASGGAGNDVLTGNTAANVLRGNDGADTLSGGAGADALFGGGDADTINGGTGMDLAGYAVASSAATWHRNANGSWTVTSAEGTDSLTNIERLSFTDRDVFLDRAARSFSGNGTSDILFRRADGIMASWEVTGTTIDTASFLPTAGAEWTPLATGDFNGDGRDDVLWQRDDGLVYTWHMNGGAVDSANAITGIGNIWTFLGVGDFNGDLKDDIAWQRDDGIVFIWQMNGAAIASANAVTGLPSDWQIAGFGDFNGDGRDDFLWRNASTGQSVVWHMNGASIASTGATSEQASLDWAIVGVGDTDGDGRDDIILQRASDGMISVWAMDGTNVLSATDVAAASPDQWTVQGIGDYNGDGRDDILWQHDNGLVYVWLMNGASIQSAGALSGIGAEWSII